MVMSSVDAILKGKRKAARVHVPPRKQRSFTIIGVLCNGQLYWPSLEVALETESVLCRIALWDSFGKEFWPRFPPKEKIASLDSPIMQLPHNTDLPSFFAQSRKWTVASGPYSSGTLFFAWPKTCDLTHLTVDLRYWYPDVPPVPILQPIIRCTIIKWLSVKQKKTINVFSRRFDSGANTW